MYQVRGQLRPILGTRGQREPGRPEPPCSCAIESPTLSGIGESQVTGSSGRPATGPPVCSAGNPLPSRFKQLPTVVHVGIEAKSVIVEPLIPMRYQVGDLPF